MNRLPCPILKNKSPYFMLFKEEPGLHTLKVFGTLTYASTLQSHRTKLDSRGRKIIFLGFKKGEKGEILLNINNHDIFMSVNVVHYEHIFLDAPNKKYHSGYNPPNLFDEILPTNHHDPQNDTINCEEQDITTLNHYDSSIPVDSDNNLEIHNSHIPAEYNIVNNESDTNSDPGSLYRPTKNRNPLSHLKNYVCSSSSNQRIPSPSGISLSSSPENSSYCINLDHELKTYEEACKDDNWLKIMNYEL